MHDYVPRVPSLRTGLTPAESCSLVQPGDSNKRQGRWAGGEQRGKEVAFLGSSLASG